MKIVAFLIADRIYKAQNGKINIEGLFGRINSKSFPALHKQLYVLTAFEGPNWEYDHILTITQDDSVVAEIHTKVNKNSGVSWNVVNEINGLPLAIPGKYIFEAKINSQEARQVIEVNKI